MAYILHNHDREEGLTWLGKKKVKKAHKKETIRIFLKENVPVGSLVVKTTDIEELTSIKEKIANPSRKIFLNFFLEAKVGNPMKLKVEDGIHSFETKSDFIVEESKNSPMTEERIKSQLEKLGGTIYQVNSIQLECDSSIFIPIQKLNELRRIAVDKISELRLERIPIEKKEYYKEVPFFPIKREKTASISTLKDYEKIKEAGKIIQPLYHFKVVIKKRVNGNIYH